MSSCEHYLGDCGGRGTWGQKEMVGLGWGDGRVREECRFLGIFWSEIWESRGKVCLRLRRQLKVVKDLFGWHGGR